MSLITESAKIVAVSTDYPGMAGMPPSMNTMSLQGGPYGYVTLRYELDNTRVVRPVPLSQIDSFVVNSTINVSLG